jgi:hypothetical protein
MTEGKFSVIIFVNNRKWKTLNNVRDNGNFQALKLYLKRNGLKTATLNLYYNGKFLRQINWNITQNMF